MDSRVHRKLNGVTLLDTTASIVDVTLSRSGPNVLRISWKTKHKNLPVSVFHGTRPETIDQRVSLERTKDRSEATLSELSPYVAHYFKIVPEEGKAIIVGERRLPLQETVNTRDLGGYETADGHRLKWGKVFRSDHLSRLSDDDIAFLKHMKIKSVCDFRTLVEAQNRPDRFPVDGHGTYFHLPVNHLKFEPGLLFEKLKNGDASWLTPSFLIKGYRLNLDQFATTWGAVFRRLADPKGLPLLFHCTGGKDRAGTFAALLLLAMGVPEKTVIDDYGLSNTYIADVVNQIYAQLNIDSAYREKIAPYFSAPKYCIEAMLSHLHDKYGSALEYLTSRAGVTQEMLQAIKYQLLE
jgi:protein-tyrosine phosphatase